MRPGRVVGHVSPPGPCLIPAPMRASKPFSCWPFFFFFFFFFGSIYIINVGLVSGECPSINIDDGGRMRCSDHQMSLLLHLKNSLKFVGGKLASWNSSADCCSWGGVTWDAAGHVVGLDLSSQFIYGGFDNSSSLFDLQSLRSLNLAYNIFYDSQIPSGFDRLPHLNYLNLSNAGFVGQIPIEISRLTKLVAMDFTSLYSSMLKLEKPSLRMLVQNLSELRELYLDRVDLSSSAQGKDWCQALSSSLPLLRVLSLSGCSLSGPLHSSLQKLRSLSIIRLDDNNFTGPFPNLLANLTELRLSSCGLDGTFPKKILQIPTLKILDLSNNELLQGSLPEFPRNASLSVLMLFKTKFSGEVPNSIGNLKRLTIVRLANCNFSEAIPNSMADLTQLVYLDMSGNQFSGGIPSLGLSKGLTQVYLSHNHLTGPISSFEWDGLVNLVVLDLRNNSLNGSIPGQLFSLPSLQWLQLSNNQFSGPLSEFSVASSSELETLDLSSNYLEGSIPESLFALRRLEVLDLSSNGFNGTVELSSFKKLGNLTSLGLSYTNLSINADFSALRLNLSQLKLASCKLREFPDLSTQSRLIYLDISDNQIPGSIPNWIWKVGNGSLMYLNLSHNLLEHLQEPLSSFPPYLLILDLHDNQLNGPIPPFFSTYSGYVDLSNNNISGIIPRSICNATHLLDLSNNALGGQIPTCLFQNQALAVLNLGKNKFIGNISGELAPNCSLQTLNLNGNYVEGSIPESLANCNDLEVLNLGNNRFNDTFPGWLENITNLRVLVLRGNKFRGQIGCPEGNSTWGMLQIMDLAHNNFSGKLPEKCFSTWTTMMGSTEDEVSDLIYLQYRIDRESYYQYGVTVTIKGLELELVKFLTIFTSIDFSCNNFEGEIPEALMGNFTMLYFMNLSHNGLTGRITSSVGNLRQLESLDLSHNRLSGEIPAELARLNFLSVLNLSYNLLVGRIPQGSQLQTFTETSYEGNAGLCGWPLGVSCEEDAAPPTSTFDGSRQYPSSKTKEILKWGLIAGEIGYVIGLGIVILPLIVCRRWRARYYQHVDRIIPSRILNQQNQGGGRRSDHTIRRRRQRMQQQQ